MLLSLVGVAEPGTNVPLLQVSPVVHGSPSLAEPVSGVLNTPVCGSQPSVVQILLSSEFTAVPGTNTPSLHDSPVVHALPSLAAPVSGVLNTPVCGSQPSVVQILLSSEFT